MIGLRASFYMVSYNPATFEHHVYIRERTGIQEITYSMTDMDSEVLIGNLIYNLYDLTIEKSSRKGLKMVELQRSRFGTSYDETTGNYRIYMKAGETYRDITQTITKSEIEELINDLIYCVHCIVNYCELI